MRGSIRKRGKNSWELTINLGRDAQGKRLRKFVNVKGKKADADRRLRELMASFDRGLPPDNGKVTVAEFLERWLADYAEPGTRGRTAQRYESDVRLYMVPAFGHLRLTQLRPSDIQALEAKLLKQGKSARSVGHLHTVLKEALKHAMRWGLLHRKVAEAVDPPRVHRKEVQPPDAIDVLLILELANETPYAPPLTFLARTGCRRGECLGLRWSDVDLENGTASIVQTLQRVRKQGLVFLPPKSAKSRRAISLDAETVRSLREHRGKQVLLKVELGDAWGDHGLVFPGALGQPLDPATLTRNFKKLAGRVGMSHVRLHDLRHFHATMLLKSGTHLKVVQERLGHASIAITADTYSHVAPGLQKAAAEAFSDAMEQATAVLND